MKGRIGLVGIRVSVSINSINTNIGISGSISFGISIISFSINISVDIGFSFSFSITVSVNTDNSIRNSLRDHNWRRLSCHFSAGIVSPRIVSRRGFRFLSPARARVRQLGFVIRLISRLVALGNVHSVIFAAMLRRWAAAVVDCPGRHIQAVVGRRES